MANILIHAINLLVLAFAAVTAIALVRARQGGASARALLFIIGLASAIGMANAWLAPLAELREAYPPAQPLMVLGLTATLLVAGFSGGGRAYFASANFSPLVALHAWRLAFGILLLSVGLMGGLPPGLFWTVALGDMIAGAWALSIWLRGTRVAKRELKFWSILGLADLLHVLPRAVITLPPFYAAHPDFVRPILLPLLGIPILIALHILLLRRIFRTTEATI